MPPPWLQVRAGLPSRACAKRQCSHPIVAALTWESTRSVPGGWRTSESCPCPLLSHPREYQARTGSTRKARCRAAVPCAREGGLCAGCASTPPASPLLLPQRTRVSCRVCQRSGRTERARYWQSRVMSRGSGWRIHCGVEVPEWSTNERYTLSLEILVTAVTEKRLASTQHCVANLDELVQFHPPLSLAGTHADHVRQGGKRGCVCVCVCV